MIFYVDHSIHGTKIVYGEQELNYLLSLGWVKREPVVDAKVKLVGSGSQTNLNKMTK